MDLWLIADSHLVAPVESAALSGGPGTSAPVGGDTDSNDVPFEESTPAAYRDEYYAEWEHLSEAPDAGEADRRNSDNSDFEEALVKKKAKKKETKKVLR